MSSVMPYQPFNPNASIMFQQPQDPLMAMGSWGQLPMTGGPLASAAPAGGGGFLDGFLTAPNGGQGWGAPMLGAVGGLAQTFLGMQQYGLAKDRLAEAKRQYNQDYAANRQLTNSRLEDRQRARVASNSGAYQSVGDYMSQYGVK